MVSISQSVHLVSKIPIFNDDLVGANIYHNCVSWHDDINCFFDFSPVELWYVRGWSSNQR